MKLFIIVFFLFQPLIIFNHNLEIQNYLYILECPHANRIKDYLGVDNLDLETKIKHSSKLRQRLKELEIKCEKNRQMKRIKNINNN